MDEKNLVFLISQPRSGSSMLQQILLRGGKIVSYPEPWFMLPLVYSYKYPGSNVIYNLDYAQINFIEYLNRFDNGVGFFKNEIKELALKLYDLQEPGDDQLVLDKTPRYYHIIDELYELFPNAKYILLIRNPVAVFASILSYNFSGNLNLFLQSPDRINDIFKAPRTIAPLRKQQRQNTFIVNYESIVMSPDETLKDLSEFLCIDELSSEYTLDSSFKETRGVDGKSVGRHQRPVQDYLESWKATIDNSQKKEIVLKYLSELGEELITTLGYDYQQLLKNVARHEV